MPALEYLMVYTQSGLPIYSKCYGGFCTAAFKNPELLTGFLSALETLPSTMGGGLSLESVKMGSTEMRFSKTTPTGHSVVIGLGKDSPDIAEDIYREVSKILASDRFVNVDWTYLTSEVMDAFEKELLETALVDALHDHGGFKDQCPLGDRCPMHTTAIQSRKGRIWSSIKDKYRAMREKMAGRS